jgi:hypothetical protein
MKIQRLFRAGLFVLVVTALLTGAPWELVAQSDITPPQLVTLSISPGTVDVSSEPQTVTFTAHVTDELSGVGYSYGIVWSPSVGQQVDFLFNRVEGDAHDGTYLGQALIPQYAEAGTWQVRYLRFYDAVGNERFLSRDDLAQIGFASEFLVTGGPDLAPPQLNSLQISPPTVTVSSAPQTVTFTAHVTDELSGVGYSYGIVWSPSVGHQVDFLFNTVGGDAHDGTYLGQALIPQFVAAGTWEVRYLRFYDAVGNEEFLSGDDLQTLGFPSQFEVISDPSDTAPPELTTLEIVPRSVNVSSGPQTVTFTAHVTDELSGVGHSYGIVWSPSVGQQVDFLFNRVGGDAHDGTYLGQALIPQYAEAGTWQVRYLRFYDAVGNERFLSGDDLQTLGFPSEFEVVLNQPPVANAGVDQNLIVKELAQFDGSGSSDPDGSIASYQWDFGDGSTGEGWSVSHAYTAPGTFTVALTVIDNEGATATDTALVVVHEVAYAIDTLSELVTSYNLKQGIANSLDAKLQNALDALSAANAGQRQDVANKLEAFINAVEAQRGKELTNAQADALVSLARRIMTVL